MNRITWFDWSKTAKQFSVNSHRKFHCQYQASRQAGKQALGLESFFLRILDTFHPFKLLFFVLGKCLMDSGQVILIFTEVWLYNFHVSW